MSAQPPPALTEEQLARIEANRQLALQRLRERQLRQMQEAYNKVEAPTANATRAGPPPLSEPSLKPAAGVAEVGPPGPAKVEALAAPGARKRAVRVTLQLESASSFSASQEASLTHVYKSIPGASYSTPNKHWTFPLSQYDNLLAKLGPDRPKGDDQIPRSVIGACGGGAPGGEVPSEEVLRERIGPTLYEALFPFQRLGVSTAIARGGRIMIADDMGLGKSIQALAVASFYEADWPLLIISPASMVACWEEQLRRWLPHLAADDICPIFDGKTAISGRITILSYDLAARDAFKTHLRQWRACAAPPGRGASGPAYGVIIADECHALKSRDTLRTRTIVPMIQEARRCILLSGTPALSRPIELYPQLSAVRADLFPTFTAFGKRYCEGHLGHFGWDFKGASNLKELQVVLERTVMIRRTKDIVMAQLPRKIRHQIILKIEPKLLAEYRSLSAASKAPLAWDDGGEDALGSLQGLPAFGALWRKTSEIKIGAMCAYIDDLLEADHKMLIFAHHQFVMDALEEHLIKRKTRLIRIDGRTASSGRQALCDAFQSDPAVRAALLSITAASTGLTLTAASCVIFAELYWNPGIIAQAEDRAHRIGQVDSVNVHYLLVKGTMDDCIWPLLRQKLTILQSVGLGKDDMHTGERRDHDAKQRTLDAFLATGKRPHEGD